MPVTGTVPLNCLTWLMAFCPMPASRVSRTSCGASGSCFFRTFTILASSLIRFSLFCRRPAVSAIRTSAPEALAAE